MDKVFEIGEPGSNIILYSSLIGRRTTEAMLQTVLSIDSHDGSYSAGPFETYSVGNVPKVDKWDFLLLLDSIHQKISSYSHLAMGRTISYIPNRPTFYTIKKQSISQEHKIHSDNDPATIRGEERQAIVMSSIISLSSKYEGGLLQFPEYGISMKLEAGDCVFFPSHGHWHAVTEVTAGDRYSLMHFWE
jgi:hypothetical protein